MGWIALLGAGISALSQAKQGQEAQYAANVQAAEINQSAQAQAQKIRKLAQQTRGQARSSLAASGVDVNTGTSDVIDEEILRDSESDAYNTILSGERQANAVRRGGEAANDAGESSALSTIVGAAGGQYSRWKQTNTIKAGVQ